MLKLQFSDRRREAVWLVDRTFTIGKNAQNSLMIEDPSILDFHAEIINQDDKLILMDKSAGKGCWVGGEQVTSHATLKQGDQIKLGNVELQLIDPKKVSSSAQKATQSKPVEENWSIHSKASWLEQNRFNINSRVIIGRDPTSDITLPLDHLSRKHVALEVKGGQLYVEDLDSSNGTFVNGERITSTTVKTGDKIKLDVVTFEVVGPNHDPNKTIIRSAPDSSSTKQRRAAEPSSAKGSAKVSSAKSAAPNKSPKPKKLAAQGKQDWIAAESPDKYKAKSELNKGPIIGIALAVIAVAIAASFLI